jgi:hypothetical protein
MTATTDLANAKTRRGAILVELAAIATTTAGGLPNSVGAVGVRVDHVGYKAGLYVELEALNKIIDTLEDNLDNETYGDYEGEVRGVT